MMQSVSVEIFFELVAALRLLGPSQPQDRITDTQAPAWQWVPSRAGPQRPKVKGTLTLHRRWRPLSLQRAACLS